MMTTSKKPLKSASRGVFEISIAETSRLLPIFSTRTRVTPSSMLVTTDTHPRGTSKTSQARALQGLSHAAWSSSTAPRSRNKAGCVWLLV